MHRQGRKDEGSRLAVLGRCARPVAIRHSLAYHAVPLLLGFAVKQSNDTHGHVVAANAASLAVAGQAVVHHVFADRVQFLLGGDASSDEFHNGLRRLAIPDTCLNE